MSDYPPAFDVLIRHEVFDYHGPHQRWWSNIKGDKGKETAWGVSLEAFIKPRPSARSWARTSW